MNTQNKGLLVFSLLVIFSLVLAACSPSTVPTPATIRETVVVTQMVAGTPVQVVVTPTAGAEEATPGPSTGFLPADGLLACKPIPELPAANASSSSIASRVGPGAAKGSALLAAAKTANQKFYGVPQAAPVQQSDKVYRVGVFEDVTSLNFWQANGPDNTVWNSYMLPPRLSLYGLSEVFFNFIPNIAAVATPDPVHQEGDFWATEIPIKKNIQWSDGEPLTAKDVAFTANTALKFGLISGNWVNWFDANYLDHLEAVDDYTVKYVYHTRPGIARHEYGALQAPILAEHYWTPLVDAAAAPIDGLPQDASEEQITAAQTEATQNLFAIVPDGEPTAGAFHLDKWEAGAFLSQTANPDYYAKGLTIQQYGNGAYQDSDGVSVGTPEGDVKTTIEVGPFAGSAVYTIYGSQDAAILALKNGEVDFVLNSLGLQRGLANQIRNDPELQVIENPENGFRYLSFNNRRRPMNDCAFRQAVAVLIDKEFVTQTILQGAAIPLYTYVSPANQRWYYDDVPKLGQGLSREQRTNLAMAILEQAGYTWEGGQKPAWDADGQAVTPGGHLIMPDGTPVPDLDLWAPSAAYDPLRSTFAVWIETWLKEFGIPVRAQLAGFNVLIPRIFTNQDFDMYILGWSLNIFPSGLRDFFSEEQAATGGNNAGGYVNPEFETLSAQLLTCPSEEECKPISNQIQTLLATESPYVVLFDTGIIEAYRSASVEYPYTEQLSGLQYTHQQGGGTLQANVKIK